MDRSATQAEMVVETAKRSRGGGDAREHEWHQNHPDVHAGATRRMGALSDSEQNDSDCSQKDCAGDCAMIFITPEVSQLLHEKEELRRAHSSSRAMVHDNRAAHEDVEGVVPIKTSTKEDSSASASPREDGSLSLPPTSTSYRGSDAWGSNITEDVRDLDGNSFLLNFEQASHGAAVFAEASHGAKDLEAWTKQWSEKLEAWAKQWGEMLEDQQHEMLALDMRLTSLREEMKSRATAGSPSPRAAVAEEVREIAELRTRLVGYKEIVERAQERAGQAFGTAERGQEEVKNMRVELAKLDKSVQVLDVEMRWRNRKWWVVLLCVAVAFCLISCVAVSAHEWGKMQRAIPTQRCMHFL